MAKKMKVGVLVQNFSEKTGKGVSKYAFNIVSHLKRKADFEIVYDNSITSFKKGLVFNTFVLPFKVLSLKADVYHAMSPEMAFPLWITGKRPYVTTIHDVIPLKLPEETNFIGRTYFRISYFFSKQSDIIITVSESSKKDIIECLGIPEEKIVVSNTGVDFDLLRKRKSEPKGNLIGYLGGFNRRKNLPLILRAFRAVAEKIPDAKLVIGGVGKASQTESIKKMVSDLGIEDKVLLESFVPEEKLYEFYSRLKVFVYPSLYEGFGMPPAEAMACGVPVVVSNVSSLPEVADGGGLAVNPDEKHVSEALIKVLTDDKLRKKLSEKAAIRAKEFDWNAKTEEVFRVYKRLFISHEQN